MGGRGSKQEEPTVPTAAPAKAPVRVDHAPTLEKPGVVSQTPVEETDRQFPNCEALAAADGRDRENGRGDLWYVYDENIGGPAPYVEPTTARGQRNVVNNRPAPAVRRPDPERPVPGHRTERRGLGNVVNNPPAPVVRRPDPERPVPGHRTERLGLRNVVNNPPAPVVRRPDPERPVPGHRTERRGLGNVVNNPPAPTVRRLDPAARDGYVNNERYWWETEEAAAPWHNDFFGEVPRDHFGVTDEDSEAENVSEAEEEVAALPPNANGGEALADELLDTAENGEAKPSDDARSSPSWDAVWVMHGRKQFVRDSEQCAEEADAESSQSDEETVHSVFDDGEIATARDMISSDLEQGSFMSSSGDPQMERGIEKIETISSGGEETESNLRMSYDRNDKEVAGMDRLSEVDSVGEKCAPKRTPLKQNIGSLSEEPADRISALVGGSLAQDGGPAILGLKETEESWERPPQQKEKERNGRVDMLAEDSLTNDEGLLVTRGRKQASNKPPLTREPLEMGRDGLIAENLNEDGRVQTVPARKGIKLSADRDVSVEEASAKGERSERSAAQTRRTESEGSDNEPFIQYVLSPLITEETMKEGRKKTGKKSDRGDCGIQHTKNTENHEAAAGSEAESRVVCQVNLTLVDGIRSAAVQPYIDHITKGRFQYKLKPLSSKITKDVTLTFRSGKQANKFVNFIRREGEQGINARIARSPREESAMDFLQCQRQQSERKIQQNLQLHQHKIEKAERLLDAAQPRGRLAPKDFEKMQDEKTARKASLDELKQQAKEFTSYTSKLMEDLTSLQPQPNLKDAAAAIRRKVGLEIRKLSTALPIYARRSEIIDAVEKHQVCIVLGETGSGKSTQMPQYLYDAGYGEKGTIVCTQPRKVAATSLAKRVAQEMATPLGNIVGYQLGRSTKSGAMTRVSYVTDHTLLNECIKDPSLRKYSCVIIDEAHERTVFTDLLIGMIKKCLVSRPDLRVIITSATIDPDVFISYFDGCPLIRVSGRMYPVDVTYEKGGENFVEDAVRKSLDVHRTEGPGDILVFLTSPVDIERACNMFTAQNRAPNVQVLPLHGRLQSVEQQKVFEEPRPDVRKIIFATNCAETSLTIPGVKYVIDTGRAKEKIYDGARNMSSLEVRFISKSSANQRKGRAGRTDSGKCYRLYTEQQYDKMESVSTPEIFRVHLGQALTKLMELGVQNPLSFDFVQAPSKETFQAAMTLLEKLGASKNGELTDLGRKMAKFPLEPRLAKFVLGAVDSGIPFSGLVTAALCTLAGTIFYRAGSEDQKDRADKLKVRFCDEQGDMLTMLFAFKEWDSVPEKDKNKWCTNNSLNAKSLRMVRDALKEIKETLTGELNIKIEHKFEDESRIREIIPKLLLGSFCDNLALFTGYDRAGYFLHETMKPVQMHPSSAFRFLGQNPQWVVYGQVLTTSQTFIIDLTRVEEDWVKELIASGVIKLDIEVLKEHLLEVELTGRVGIKTGLGLAGKKFSQLRDLQDQIRAMSETPLAYLDLNLNIGRIQLVGCYTYSEDVLSLLKETVDAGKTSLSAQLKEEAIVPNSDARLVVGSGGTVKHVMMPGEFRSVLLLDVPVEMTRDEVAESCSCVGTVTECFRFSKPAGNKWGKVTFADPDSARSAVEDAESFCFPFGLKASSGPVKGLKHGFQAKMEWCRKAPTGIAYVGFEDEEDAQMARSMIRFLQIGHATVQVQPGNRDPRDLFIKRLPGEATRDSVGNAVIQMCDEMGLGEVKLTKVVVPRQKETTMPGDVNDLRRQLIGKIKQYYEGDNFDVNVLRAKDHHPTFVSYATFCDVRQGMNVVEAMDRKETIRNQLICITPIIKTSMTIREDVYGVIEARLHRAIEDAEAYEDVSIKLKESRYGEHVVEISSNDMQRAAAALARLQDVTKGVVVAVTSTKAFQQLVHPGRKGWLIQLQNKTKTVIRIDSRQSQLTIHGDKNAERLAKDEIKAYVRKCANQDVKVILLKSEGLPAGLMKLLLVTYGIHLTDLQTDTKAAHLEINIKQHTLSVSGSMTSIEKVQEKIDKLSEQLREQPGVVMTEQSVGDCPVCFCPVSAKDCYILECCGHPYCKDCIGMLLTNGVKNREFPMRCAEDGCQQLLFLVDLEEILKLTQGTWKELQEASLDSYMSENEKKYKYCVTPDCPMVYRPSTDGTLHCCSGCHVTICTTCHVEQHSGITCDTRKIMSGLDKDDESLKQWLAADQIKRSLCPVCKAPIEKFSGCNKLQCAKCKAVMCWKCKEVFPNEDKVYAHISRVHGGY